MTETLPTALDPQTLVGGREFRMLVGGELRAAAGGVSRDTIDPSTGARLTAVPEATAADVGDAVSAARAAQPAWEALGVRGRSERFLALADAVEARAEELAALDAIDGGNPLAAMRDDVRISVAQSRAWPQMATWLYGRTIPASPGNLHYTLHKPYGVVGRIVPFNHPLMFAVTRILAALVTGNTVVLKPAHQTPLSALAFGEIAREVLPAGVVNVVTGGAETGDALVTDPRVKRIAFTGSGPTGMAIQRRAAAHAVKHVTLELGGKNPMLVFPDVDLDEVVDGAVTGMNFGACQGQSCGSNSRVFVHRDRYDDVVGALAARLERMTVGAAYEPGIDMGPLVSREHHERVTGYVEAGREEGARLVTGGVRPPGVGPGGYYLAPTVFADVDPGMRIAREEIFGPVISVLPWSDYGTLVEQANDVELGLTASIWTSDLTLAHKTAERLEAGYIWINDSTTHYWGTPFGGLKNSGIGREESIEELESYLELKTVHTILGDPDESLARLERGGA